MIDKGSRTMAFSGHVLMILGILLPLWLIFFYQSKSFFTRDPVEVAIPIIAACLLLLGKALAIPAALCTGHESPLKTSLTCDIFGIVVNGLLAANILSLQSGAVLFLATWGASLLGFIFFLNYLQGTAEHVGDERMAGIPARLYRGCGLIVLTGILCFFAVFIPVIGGLALKLFYLLLILWVAAYLYLIGGTGYKLHQQSN